MVRWFPFVHYFAVVEAVSLHKVSVLLPLRDSSVWGDSDRLMVMDSWQQSALGPLFVPRVVWMV